ncbi:MAG: FG-GAP-like repeat-containing protein [bacterium]
MKWRGTVWVLGCAVWAAACDEGDKPAAVDAGADAAVDAAIDASPDATPLGAVRFTEPLAGAVIGGEADLDGELATGIQIEARAAAEGADDGRVVFRVGDRASAAPLVDGRAVAVLTLPALADGAVRLTAEIESGGRLVADEIDVTVRVRTCALAVEPLPGGGACDAGPDADLDPARPGVQVELVARTDCARVEVVAGGVPRVAAVEDGLARVPVTLADGDTEVHVTARATGAWPAALGPLRYRARAAAPDVRLDLNAGRATVLGLTPAVVAEGRAYWTITGDSDGLEPGAMVALTYAPPLPGAPASARVDDDGRFVIELSVALGEAWAGELGARATDACGTASPEARHALRLDAVTPALRIVAPPAGLLTAALDLDPARPGVQVAFTVAAADPRPDVDYRVSVACGPAGLPPTDRAVGPGDAPLRSALGEVPVVATFEAHETGEITCLPTAAPSPNPPTAEAERYRLFFDRPRLVLAAPAPGCTSALPLRVAGRGASLAGNDPALVAVLTPADGGEVVQAPLAGDGDTQSVEIAGLAEGAWTLTVEGTVFGEVPIEVTPASVALTIDRSPPALRVLAPEDPITDADPATPGYQLTPRIEVCGASGATLRVALDPPVAGPFEVPVPPGDCPVVALPPLTAPLTPLRLTATVADACAEARAERTAAIDAVTATLIAPPTIGAALDADPAAPGCQLELDARVDGPGPDAVIRVCPAADPACAAPRCVVTGVVGAGATLRCPVDLADAAHELVLTVDAGALVSPPVALLADCSPPAVTALAIADDNNGDGCVNRAERQNAAEASQSARIRVTWTTEGLAPETPIRLRTDAGLDLGGALAGAGEATVTLPPGLHRLALRGQDAAGNPLPEPPALTATVRVDTGVPAPALLGLADGSCLAAADDLDPAAPGARVELAVTAGAEPGEPVTATVRLDGAVIAEAQGADALRLPLDLPEGPHALQVTVADACGNAATLDRALTVDTLAPEPRILGLDDGAVLGPADDADPAPGFQLDLALELAVPEPGLAVTLEARDPPAPLRTEPPALVFDDGPLPARLTLAGGPRTLIARAVDACGNEGTSAPVALTLDLPGCPSRVTAPLGALAEDAGTVRGDTLTLPVTGAVDLTDLDCAGAPAALLRDGQPIAEATVAPDGAVRFDDVTLTRGPQTLTLRVGPVRGTTLDSPAVAVTVDLETPTLTITRPEADPALILTDDRPDLPGQQLAVTLAITEATIDSPREVTLTLDGAALEARPAPGPTLAVELTLTPGPHQLEACVTDLAGHRACATRTLDADPDAPGPVTAAAEITDPRATEVVLRFPAPADDLAGGPVVAYVIRSAATPFAAEADWIAAAATELVLPAAAPPGAPEALVIRGPGPTLQDGLALDRLHHLAIRARDDAGRLGPLTTLEVDLRLTLDQGTLPARGGAWEAGELINTTNSVIALGDLDADGHDDLVVAATQSATATAAALVFGGPAPETRPLALAPGMTDAFFGVAAAAAGDLNGDGAPDLAVQGYREGFTGTAIALYFGCPGAPCDRAALATPDALIHSVGGRFTNALAGVGDATALGDPGHDDLLVGGGLAGETTAFVVAGRRDWPPLPAAVTVGPAPADRGPAVALLTLPLGPAAVYAAGLGDLDGDGFAELALSAGPDINAVFVFAGGFADAATYDPRDPRTVRLTDPCPQPGATFGSALAGGADLDGDGRPDLVVGNRANKRLVVFSAELAPLDCFGRTPAQFGRVFDLAGDIDGDGAIDLVATHGDPAVTEASVFYNDGLGRFGVGAQVSPRLAHVRLDRPARRKLGVAGAGDFDGDGRADLAALVLIAGEMTWVVYR